MLGLIMDVLFGLFIGLPCFLMSLVLAYAELTGRRRHS